MNRLRNIFYLIVGLFSCLVGLEISSRFEDFLRWETPIFGALSREQALTIVDEGIVKGRPNGRFRKWKLNQFGFRSPEIDFIKKSDCLRIMILGSSETFGLYERPEHEYPSVLHSKLNLKDCFEVINASLAGMRIGTMEKYWRIHAAKFKPDIVIIYPNALFYLDENADSDEKPSQVVENKYRFSPRLVLRAQDLFHGLPMKFREIKWRRDLEMKRSGHGRDWFYTEVPLKNINLYINHLEHLIKNIKETVDQLYVFTPTIRVLPPFRDSKWLEVQNTLSYYPRASPEIILNFNAIAASRIRSEIQPSVASIIDLDKDMSGTEDYFSDFNHFSDKGAARVAELISSKIVEIDNTRSK